jgi:glycosyltransferase involved in cell wall biosynthesis
VHLLAPAPFGGLESVVTTLSRAQLENGQKVVVASLVPPGPGVHPFVQSLREAGVPTRTLSTPDRGYMGERRGVRALLQELRPDVLHTHGYRPDVVDSGVARKMGIFTASTVHGFTGLGVRGRLYEWLQCRWLRRFDAVISVSEPLKAVLETRGVPADRLHLITNAWRPSRPPLDRDAARAALGIPVHEVVVGWVGRMSVEKGPDLMIEALSEYPDPSLRLSMVGTGPMEESARRLAGRLALSDRVRWHGAVPEAGRYLAAFDAVLLTSRTEGTPIVLLEAMAAGVPVVAAAVGGIPNVVSSKEAVLVAPEDPKAVALGLGLALSDDEVARSRPLAARARLARDFAVDAWVRRYNDIYSP